MLYNNSKLLYVVHKTSKTTVLYLYLYLNSFIIIINMAKPLNENYIAHIAAVFGGAELYQAKKTKNPEIITFVNAKNQLLSNRINIQLKDLFQKRSATFLPRLQLQQSFSDEEIQSTLDMYFSRCTICFVIFVIVL